MAKGAKLKRADRRQPEPDLEIEADPSAAAQEKLVANPYIPPPQKSATVVKKGKHRGSMSSAKSRAKKEKAIEREEKLETRKMVKELTRHKVKAAKS